MSSRWRRRILTAGGLACLAAMFGCFGAGLWFQDRKHIRSGVPNHHWATREVRWTASNKLLFFPIPASAVKWGRSEPD